MVKFKVKRDIDMNKELEAEILFYAMYNKFWSTLF
jgi:hypothetical protein